MMKGGKSAMKPFWDVTAEDVKACLEATQWAPASLGYFRGGGYSSQFLTCCEFPVTMARLNWTLGQGPVLQLAEGYTVSLPPEVNKVLDERTDPTWPTTWFAPLLTGKGPFRDVYSSACWNASKMIFCFSGGMPMPVSDDFERDHRGRLAAAPDVRRSSRRAPRRTLSRTPPCAVNLKAFDSRFFSTCCRRLESVMMLRPRLGSICDVEGELPRLRLVAERPRHHVQQIGEEDLLGVDRDRAGFDLRQVEDVADEVEQVGAGAVDGAGELDLLGVEIAVRVVGQLLAEDEDRC